MLENLHSVPDALPSASHRSAVVALPYLWAARYCRRPAMKLPSPLLLLLPVAAPCSALPLIQGAAERMSANVAAAAPEAADSSRRRSRGVGCALRWKYARSMRSSAAPAPARLRSVGVSGSGYHQT